MPSLYFEGFGTWREQRHHPPSWPGRRLTAHPTGTHVGGCGLKLILYIEIECFGTQYRNHQINSSQKSGQKMHGIMTAIASDCQIFKFIQKSHDTLHNHKILDMQVIQKQVTNFAGTIFVKFSYKSLYNFFMQLTNLITSFSFLSANLKIYLT